MSEPLFTNVCIPDPPPKVTFEFIDVCDIPPPPPPIYDCSLPPVPPFDKPPPCPEIEPGIVTVTVDNRRSVCAPAAIPPGGRLKIRKDPEDCTFVFDLDIDVPVITPPCPDIRGGVVNVRTRTGNCEPGGENKITVKKGDPCDDVCDFEIDLDIVVDIPPPPCPKINGGSVSVRSGYGECGTVPGGTVIVTPKVTTDICGVEACEFDIDIDIEVPIPTPPCPKITSRYRTGKSPSLTTSVTGGDACDGDDCTIDIEIEFPEPPEPPCVPVFTPGSITVRQSDNPSSNNQFLIERVQNPNNPEECTYRPFGYIQIPKIPQMPEIPAWVKNTPKAPCIPTYTGGAITGNKVKGKITVSATTPPPEEPEEPEEPREECLGSCWVVNQEPFNINTADAYGPAQDTLWGTCYPMSVLRDGRGAAVSDAVFCKQMGGGNEYYSGNDCKDCPPAPPQPTPTPTQPKPCSELQISAELEIEIPEPEPLPEPCVSKYYGSTIEVQYVEPTDSVEAPSNPFGGSIMVKPLNDPTTSANREREYAVGSCHLNFQQVYGVDIFPAGCNPWVGPGKTPASCEGIGGGFFASGDCSSPPEGCGDYEISGVISISQLCPKFEAGKITKKSSGGSTSTSGSEDGSSDIGTIKIESSGDATKNCKFSVSAEIDMDALGAGGDCVPEGGEISVTVAEKGESGGGKIIISEGEQSGTKGSCKQGQGGECYPDYTRDECEGSGGEWFPGDGCSKKSCGYTISADIKLPSELAEIEFEPAEGVTLDAVECDEPASISVNIVKGEDGKYKIEVSGDYPDCSACCPVDSEVTLGPRREAMRRLDIGMGI